MARRISSEIDLFAQPCVRIAQHKMH